MTANYFAAYLTPKSICAQTFDPHVIWDDSSFEIAKQLDYREIKLTRKERAFLAAALRKERAPMI